MQQGTTYAGIYVGPGVIADVSDNPSIVGAPGFVNKPQAAFGIFVDGGEANVRNCSTIFGGYGQLLTVGVRALDGTLTLQDSRTLPGAAPEAVSVSLEGTTSALLRRNLIMGCGIPTTIGSPAPDCLTPATSTGLRASGASVEAYSNMAFGGFGKDATACDISTNGTVHLYYNLCLAQGRATTGGETSTSAVGLRLHPSGGLADTYVFRNNVIGTNPSATQRFVLDDSPQLLLAIDFQFNALIPDNWGGVGLAAYRRYNGIGFEELDTLGAVEALDDGSTFIMANNLTVDPIFADPTPWEPDVSGYKQNAALCNLDGLGSPVTVATGDIDCEQRDDTAPAVGPDECMDSGDIPGWTCPQ